MGINFYNFLSKPFLSTIAFLFVASIGFASTPLSYGDELTAWINNLGESHTYTFQGTSGDRIFIRARGTSGGVDACIELFDPSGASVAMDCDDGGYVTIDGYELSSTGTYTIIGKDHDDNDTGFYGLSLHILNNSEYSTSIDCQQDIAGTLTHQAEVDAYSYTANAGDVVVMRMRSTTGNIESKIRLYDPSGNVLAEASPSGGTSKINPISLPTAGDYTILCYDKNGNDTGDYGFSFQVINPTACAENISCGTFSADITKIAEMHAYAFQAEMGDRIYINMRGSAGLEAELELYDANGVEIASDNPNGGTAEIEDFYINASGTYFVLARDRKGNDTGSYGFSLQNLGKLECATEIDCNTNLSSSIDALAEMDIYYFEASAGERVMLQMRANSNSLEGELFLYDSNGNLVGEDSPGGGLCEVVDTEIPADGIYFAMVKDKHGNDTGAYGFSFQKLDPTCATAYNCGSGEVTGTFNSLTAMDAYYFTGNAGDIINITFEETGTDLEPLLYVYDPDNNRIIDETASHDINVNDFELTQTGTYIALAMDRNGNDLGSYTLNIDCAANTDDSTPPSIVGCDDATFSCEEISGGSNSDSPTPISMNWGAYNMEITFDNSVEVVSGTCIFGDMSIVDNGCGGIRTACYGNTLQFTPDWATCGGPFPELPFTIDFGTGLMATFDEGGNASIDSYGGNSGGGTVVEEWLTEVTATDDNGSASISNDFDPNGFSCNGGSAGTQVVTFTAVDESNNISTCSATITVTDNTAPTFDNQAAEISGITDGDDLPFQETLTATDACGNAMVVKSVDSYEVNNCGDYQITYRWTATDDCGNSTELTKTFDVLFNSDAFSANCPEDFTITIGEEGFVQLDAEELWGFENGCTFNFFSTGDNLYFDCTDAGDHDITFSVMSDNQVLTVCNFTITVDASNCGGLNNLEYCESYGNANGNKWIQSFTIGEHINWSGSDDGYGDYTTEVIDLTVSSSITIELDPNHNSAKHKWAIWIDYNQDGTFDDDEQAFSASGKNTLYGTINIPEGVSPGNTRMRVSMKTGWAPEPCSTFNPGEVEDYTVNFVSGSNFGGLPPSNTPQNNSQTTPPSQPVVKLFPNPTRDYVMVDISKFNNQNGIIQIHNSMGTQVWSSGKQPLTNNIYQVDISTLKVPAGIYQVSVIYGKESITRTIYINNE